MAGYEKEEEVGSSTNVMDRAKKKASTSYIPSASSAISDEALARYYRAFGKIWRKRRVLEHKRRVQESILILTQIYRIILEEYW
uniref:Uncharacterized protein n=1 Tax=Tanacetum cinerariifolium TaxID=118510 RepID=A0A6L2MQX5_TANCI|nr:hypothetical protein [Tanacetum cinerariifolium]